MLTLRTKWTIGGVFALMTCPLQGSGTVETVYVTNWDCACISAYTMDATTGVLTGMTGSPFRGAEYPWSAVFDPRAKFGYVVSLSGLSGGVVGYTVGAATGTMKTIAGSPFATGGGASSTTVSPNGKFAYVSTSNQLGLYAYTISATTGVLSPVSGSPYFPGGYSTAIDPKSKFLYMAAYGVSGFAIDAATGALTAVIGSPFPAGNEPYSIVVDPTGRFVYTTNIFDDTISGYSIDAATGVLTPIPGSPFNALIGGPDSIAINPTATFVYVSNFGSQISGFTIDSSTGALTPIAGSPFSESRPDAPKLAKAAGRMENTSNTVDLNAPNSLAVDPSGMFAYGVNFSSDTISGFSIDSTGALTPIAGSPFETEAAPSSIAFGPKVAKVTEQTPPTIYSFQSGNDGANPVASLAIGANGVLYGASSAGGNEQGGTVFSLTPPVSSGSPWTESTLHSFTGGTTDGFYPSSVAIGSDGTLYGTAYMAGSNGFGMAYSLTPPASPGGQWTETVLHNFEGGPNDGAYPYYGALAMNRNGVLYGTTESGGGLGVCQPGGCGTVFSLTPPKSPGGKWREDILWSFSGATDGATPLGGVALGKAGVLYGTTFEGINAQGGDCTDQGGCGGVFQLTPPSTSGGKWTETILTSFSDIGQSYAGVVIGAGGALYGTTVGYMYALWPPAVQGEGWSASAGPYFPSRGSLSIDANGVLYGVSYSGGLGFGQVALFTPPTSATIGVWTYTDLWELEGPPNDGNYPWGGVIVGPRGILYGTTEFGGNGPCGSPGCGTVFALKP